MQRLPEWLRTGQRSLHGTKSLLRRHGLSSVCEEARCPNRGDCFSLPTAAFLILGPSCTRNCAFCAVVPGAPAGIDPDEPARVADAAAEMGLQHVVVTSVTRDDLSDGGAGQFAATIAALRQRLPQTSVEVLIPDFAGDRESLEIVLEARPDVLNHNMETVARLYGYVRPQADYQRSLDILREAKRRAPGMVTKSGFMVGMGETADEVISLLQDLRRASCEFLTIGQYLRPSKKNHPVVEYIRPEAFSALGRRAQAMGFRRVAAGPLVRSSMHAGEMYHQNDGGETGHRALRGIPEEE